MNDHATRLGLAGVDGIKLEQQLGATSKVAMSLVIVDASAGVRAGQGQTSLCKRVFRHCFQWLPGRSLMLWPVDRSAPEGL